MIPRITRGSSAYGAMSYDHGPGRYEEHRNPHKVAGNVAGRSWKDRSAAIDSHVQRMHPKLTNPIIRTSLRIAPEDRRLTDREWREVANEYVSKMGFSGAPWEAVRHADDHIHLTMSRVNWDGSTVDQWKDKTRAQGAVRAIEQRHGLIDASRRYNRDVPQLSRNDRERAERESRQSGRPRTPEKAQLRERIDDAHLACDGSRQSFEAELHRRGVTPRANISKPTERHPDGKMNGYSYGLSDHSDSDGQPVWFKGSDLGQKYGWKQTSERLIETERTRPRDAAPATGSNQHPVEGKAARSGVAAAPDSYLTSTEGAVVNDAQADTLPGHANSARERARAIAQQRERERESLRRARTDYPEHSPPHLTDTKEGQLSKLQENNRAAPPQEEDSDDHVMSDRDRARQQAREREERRRQQALQRDRNRGRER